MTHPQLKPSRSATARTLSCCSSLSAAKTLRSPCAEHKGHGLEDAASASLQLQACSTTLYTVTPEIPAVLMQKTQHLAALEWPATLAIN